MSSGTAIGPVLEDVRAGRPVLVTGPLEGRGTSVLMASAQQTSAEVVNFMVRHGGGLICLALTGERWDELGLRPQPRVGDSVFGTDFGVSIEAREGVTTGISAADRARTIAVACDLANGPDAIAMPGHVLPVRAVDGSVLERSGQAEAAVELARLAGQLPAGVICDVIGEDGSPATTSELLELAEEHRLRMIAVEDLVIHKMGEVTIVERGPSQTISTEVGEFHVIPYRERATGREHLALLSGRSGGDAVPLVRLHLACVGEHLLTDCGADCGARLHQRMGEVAAAEYGVLLYMAGRRRRHAVRPDPKLEVAATQILTDLGVETNGKTTTSR